MTPEELHEEAHQRKEKLWKQIHDLLDEELTTADDEVESIVRQSLTETFRFWKRST